MLDFHDLSPRPAVILSAPPGSDVRGAVSAIARRRERTAVVDCASLRAMLAHPRLEPWEGSEGRRQHLLAVEMAAGLANHLSLNGWEVLITDLLDHEIEVKYRRLLDAQPLVVVLLPARAALAPLPGDPRPLPPPDILDALHGAQAAYGSGRATIALPGEGPEAVASGVLALLAAHLEHLAAPDASASFAAAEAEELLLDFDPGDW